MRTLNFLQASVAAALDDTMDAISAQAAERGLIDDTLQAEGAAYNSERQGSSAPATP
jgi:hypothetical protein